MEHIMGYIMFRHRKLVVVLVRYINITLLHAWWLIYFSFDKSVPLPILYLLTKNKQLLDTGILGKKGFFSKNKQLLDTGILGEKRVFFTTAPSNWNFDQRIHLVFGKRDFGRYLAWNKVYHCNLLVFFFFFFFSFLPRWAMYFLTSFSGGSSLIALKISPDVELEGKWTSTGFNFAAFSSMFRHSINHFSTLA